MRDMQPSVAVVYFQPAASGTFAPRAKGEAVKTMSLITKPLPPMPPIHPLNQGDLVPVGRPNTQVLLKHTAGVRSVVLSPIMQLPSLLSAVLIMSTEVIRMCMTCACLIALDKNPGVRIGDTARCTIAKAILNIIRQDVQAAASSLQLCAGQIAGIKAAVHAACSLFLSEDTEANLLVGTSNAFNSLNRQTALHNIQGLCPSLATTLINMYRAPSELYVDGDVLLSQEGTTQGDPLATPMYALATIPLIGKLKNSFNDVHIRHRHLVMDKYSYLVTQVKKERIRRQTSTPGHRT